MAQDNSRVAQKKEEGVQDKPKQDYFDSLFYLGFSYLKLSADGFWDATPAEINWMYFGEKERREEQERGDWERARFTGYLAFAPHAGKNSKVKKPSDLVKFSWEREAEIQKQKESRENAPQLSKEEKEKLLLAWSNPNNKKRKL